MNPKKLARLQKALIRRQGELQAWIDGTYKVDPYVQGQTAKKKQTIAEKDIAALTEKLGHKRTQS